MVTALIITAGAFAFASGLFGYTMRALSLICAFVDGAIAYAAAWVIVHALGSAGYPPLPVIALFGLGIAVVSVIAQMIGSASARAWAS